MTTESQAPNRLYFAAWRWHFYAGLYVVPFLIMLAVTGLIMPWIASMTRSTVSVSGIVMWVKRHPAGARLGAPPRPADIPYAKGALFITLGLSLAVPMLGLVLLTVIVLDLVILSAVPPLKRRVS